MRSKYRSSSDINHNFVIRTLCIPKRILKKPTYNAGFLFSHTNLGGAGASFLITQVSRFLTTNATSLYTESGISPPARCWFSHFELQVSMGFHPMRRRHEYPHYDPEAPWECAHMGVGPAPLHVRLCDHGKGHAGEYQLYGRGAPELLEHFQMWCPIKRIVPRITLKACTHPEVQRSVTYYSSFQLAITASSRPLQKLVVQA